MPFHSFPSNPVRVTIPPAVGADGLRALSRQAADDGRSLVIAIDGMWGVRWDQILSPVAEGLGAAGREPAVIRTADFLRAPEALRSHFQPWLTDNPVFGRVCSEPLAAYFDLDRLQAAIAETRLRSSALVVIGPYALAVCPEAALGLYCDLPREEIIRRQMSGGLRNLGDDQDGTAGDRYKIAYYVEWPLLEAYNRQMLLDAASPLTHYVGCQDESRPVTLSRQSLAEAVAGLTTRPFRCKPFFMPGVWGGQRLKEVGGLPADWPNTAWDFEIVAPENGVTVEMDGTPLTIPFHLLLWLQPRELMGELVYRQFGEYFPVRVNYLDTMGGTNLSMQVHPPHTYMRQQFGEPIGQDESYYIVESEPGSLAYVGLKETTTREGLTLAVRRAEEESVPFEITDYVNSWEANPGDLFLIPAGTVHCSGANNLVLEISSTPYWYTFKIYDYLRLDLSGKPRPINSAHAFAVIDFTRKTDWVRRYLIPEPVELRRAEGGTEFHIGSTAMTAYAINRLHIQTEMADCTAGGFILLTVVKGEGARILAVDQDEPLAEMAYLETWVLPAAFGDFRIQAVGQTECQVVKTYVRR